jgi:DNA mismatch repair protein MutL
MIEAPEIARDPLPPKEPEAEYFLSPPRGPAPSGGDLVPIGQLKDSYILAQGEDGLYIIDQHAAHERILYNQLKKNLEERALASQSLMFPETRKLSPHQALAAEKLAARLAALGFELTHLGGTDFMLRAAPAILGRADPWETLTEILDASQDNVKRLDGAGLDENLSRLTGTWLDSLACRAAVKAGQKLSFAEMSRLLHDMAQTQSGAYCPHGRPAIQRYSFSDIAKKFHR